ncbi:hypothetical protein [Streptomyces sp. CB00316]|uniref:hypothetical protein n=1 Tax=Streptomyces sp. CB00316 TaxID=1703932 RepID=UPI0018FEC9D3|nr:hypothetical protein [Streptomyces sp. CB00316]
MEDHHDVEVRHRRAAGRHGAASQERSLSGRVVFLYNGTRGGDRIHAATISILSTVRTGIS